MYPCSHVLDMTSHTLQLWVLYMHITMPMAYYHGALKTLLKVVRAPCPHQLKGFQDPSLLHPSLEMTLFRAPSLESVSFKEFRTCTLFFSELITCTLFFHRTRGIAGGGSPTGPLNDSNWTCTESCLLRVQSLIHPHGTASFHILLRARTRSPRGGCHQCTVILSLQDECCYPTAEGP